MPIYFYSQHDEYGYFSNFSAHGFELDGRYWPTVEHYFQAQKFPDPAQQARIAQARTPKAAKALAWKGKQPIRADWDQVRDAVMLRALRQKFQTHAALRQLLLVTGDELLIEKSPTDYYWGCGADGSGQNRLGELLMQVRTELGHHKYTESA